MRLFDSREYRAGLLFLASATAAWESFFFENPPLIRLFFVAFCAASSAITLQQWITPRPLHFPVLNFCCVFATAFWVGGMLFSWGVQWKPSLVLNDLFDVLGAQLLRGTTEVPRETVRWEAFESVNGTTTYFGLFPALLRIPLNAVFTGLRGGWSGIMMFIAAVGSLSAVCALSDQLLTRTGAITGWLARICFCLLPLAVGFGSPLVYLCGNVSVYHECILWGLCGSLWSAFWFSRIQSEPGGRATPKVLFALSVGCTLLARLTFALPWLGVSVFLVLSDALHQKDSDTPSVGRRYSRVGWILPLLAALAVQAWYNFDRFGSVTTVFPISQYHFHLDEPARAVAPFEPERLRTGVSLYLSIRTLRWLAAFPLPMPGLEFVRGFGLSNNNPEPMASFLLSSLWLNVFAAMGLLITLVKPPPLLQRLLHIGLLFQVLLILIYYFPSYRFSAEFVPLTVVLAAETVTFALLHRRFVFQAPFQLLSFLTLSYSSAATALLNALAVTSVYPADSETTRELARYWIDLLT